MHTFKLRIHLSLLLLGLAPACLPAQGILTPSAAPAPLMRTLDQLESRTPLGTPGQVTTATITIAASGSYVLTGPVTVASGDGIVIAASNVTLDLNGFTVSSSASPAAGVGISLHAASVAGGPPLNLTIPGARRNVRIFNGYISTTRVESFAGEIAPYSGPGFIHGIAPSATTSLDRVQVRDITVTGCAGRGIYLSGQSRVENCQMENIATIGIEAELVTGCSVENSGGNAIVGKQVSGSRGKSVSGIGIVAEIITHSHGQTAGSAVSLSCGIAIGCTYAGTNPPAIGNRYDMP